MHRYVHWPLTVGPILPLTSETRVFCCWWSVLVERLQPTQVARSYWHCSGMADCCSNKKELPNSPGTVQGNQDVALKTVLLKCISKRGISDQYNFGLLSCKLNFPNRMRNILVIIWGGGRGGRRSKMKTEMHVTGNLPLSWPSLSAFNELSIIQPCKGSA